MHPAIVAAATLSVTDPAFWVPIVVAIVALLGVAASVWQKDRNDQRSQWWDRVQWALDALQGGEERRNIGLAILDRLASDTTVEKDRLMIEEAILATLDPYAVDEEANLDDDTADVNEAVTNPVKDLVTDPVEDSVTDPD